MSTPDDQIQSAGPIPDYAADAADPAPETSSDPAPAPAPPPDGHEQVDFNLIPPEHRDAFEARFNRLYFQIKQGQRERAEERRLYQGLDSKLDKFISAADADRQQTKIELLTEKANKLFEAGDHAEGVEMLKKIVKAERDLPAAKTAPPAAGPAPFTDEDRSYLQEFAVKNSWASPQSPHFEQTKKTLSRFLANGIAVKDAVDATTDIMSDLVGKLAPAGGRTEAPIVQAVLGGNRTSQATVDKAPELNEYEINVARKFWPRLTPKEAMAKYLKSKLVDRG